MGVRVDARVRARLPRRALRHRPRGGRGAGRRYVRSGEPRGRSGWSRARAPRSSASSGSPTAEQGAATRPPANIRTHVASGRRRSAARRGGSREARRLEPSFFQDPKRIAQTVVVLIVIAAIYFLFPKLVGVEDGIRKLGDGDPVWIAHRLRLQPPDVRLVRRPLQGRRGRAARPALERELPDHDGGARGHPPVLGGRRGGHRPHVLGAAQGGNAAPAVGEQDGRVPGPPLTRSTCSPS